jgi:hypothetical protein
MRREVFISATKRVVDALKGAEIQEALDGLVQHHRGPAGAGQRTGPESAKQIHSVMNSFARFRVYYNSFGDDEKFILGIFSLEELAASIFWTKAVVEPPDSVIAVRSSVIFANHYLPKLMIALERTTDSKKVFIKTDKKDIPGERIEFLIKEDDSPTLTAKQFSEILAEVEALYHAITRVYALEAGELIVGSLDSGSEKSFEVFGIARSIQKFGEILLEAWDRVRFRSAQTVQINLKAALDGLSVLSEIATLEKKNVMQPEEAEALKRGIIRNIEHLFHNGVFTKEMETQKSVRPSELTVERKKLITFSPEKDKGPQKKPPKNTKRLRDAEADEEDEGER